MRICWCLCCGLCNLQIVLVNRKFIAGGNGGLRISSDYTCSKHLHAHVYVLVFIKRESDSLGVKQGIFYQHDSYLRECSSTEIKKLKSFSIFFIFRFFETRIILKIAAILVSWELGRFNQKFKLSSVCQSFEVLINQFT